MVRDWPLPHGPAGSRAGQAAPVGTCTGRSEHVGVDGIQQQVSPSAMTAGPAV